MLFSIYGCVFDPYQTASIPKNHKLKYCVKRVSHAALFSRVCDLTDYFDITVCYEELPKYFLISLSKVCLFM